MLTIILIVLLVLALGGALTLGKLFWLLVLLLLIGAIVSASSGRRV